MDPVWRKSFIDIDFFVVYLYTMYKIFEGFESGDAMDFGLAMIKDELGLEVLYADHGGRESYLDLRFFQIYDGEEILEDHTCYLSVASAHQDHIQGGQLAAMIIIKDVEEIIYPECPFILVGGEYQMIALSNQVNALFRKMQTIEQKLQEAVYTGQGFQALVDIFADVPHNEIIMMNSDFYLIAHSNEDIQLYQMSGLQQDHDTQRLPADNLEFFKNDIVYSKVRDLREPFIYQASIYAVDVLCMNVFLHDKFVCRVVFCEIDTKFRPYDKELLRYFTGWIQKKYDLLKAEDIYQRSSRLNSIFFDLIQKKKVGSRFLAQALSDHGWDMDTPFICVLLQPSERDYYNRTLSYYCQIISERFHKTVSFEIGSRIFCVVDLDGYRHSGDAFIEEFVYFLRDSFFKGGFSNEFLDIGALYSYYKQAEIALETGILTRPSIWSYRFEEEFLTYVYQRLTDDISAEYLIHPKVQILRQYDAMNNTTYIKTLDVYLSCMLNAVETSKRLYIHRTTMMYRLKRIKELAKINFDDPQELLYLMISCRLLL